MPKVKTVHIKREELKFSYTVNVSAEGVFSTTIPKEITSLFESQGVNLIRNRLGNPGYFSGKTMDDVLVQVGGIVKEFFSRELTYEKIIIDYAIETTCSYAKGPDGEIIPGPAYISMDDYSKRKVQWIEGTESTHSGKRRPFGLLVYAEPKRKKVYTYRSGKTTTEYESLHESFRLGELSQEKNFNLHWLDTIASIDPPDGGQHEQIEYDEKVALFFVDLLKAICIINEKIKDKFDPATVKEIAHSGRRLLT